MSYLHYHTIANILCIRKPATGGLPGCPRSPLYYITYPRRFARNASYEYVRTCTWLFLAYNDPGTPEQVVAVAAIHHISWATARAGPSEHVGGLMGTVNVRYSTPDLMGSEPGRPVKTHGPPQGPGGAALTETTSHGPRPGPSHPIFILSRPGPGRPIKSSKVSARHGPA